MNKIKSLTDWLRRKSPRMTLPSILATVLILAVVAIAPHQAPVLIYKLGDVAGGGVLGYLLDVAAFPYAKPSGYLRVDWRDVDNFEDDRVDFGFALGGELPFLIACARRAAIMCACMLAVALAL
ncbi:putative holin [Humidesulfovibrio idahonensis]